MKYYKSVNNGYICGANTSTAGNGNITEEEYNEIVSLIRNRPIAPKGYEYRLREDLEWELVELPPDPDPGEVIVTDEEISEALEGIL